MNTHEYELTPRYDRCKSFYRKAFVIEGGTKLLLRSYNTIVATIENGIATVYGTYSTTTLRHINEFLKQNGFTGYGKREILEHYGTHQGSDFIYGGVDIPRRDVGYSAWF